MKVGPWGGRGWGVALLVAVLLAAALPSIPAAAATPEPWPEQRLTTEHWYTAQASVVDAQGRVHLAALRTGADPGVRYLRPSGDTWVEEAVAPDRHPWGVAIAFDPAGRPVIAWDHGRTAVRIATRTDRGWQIERVPAPRLFGGGLSLAFDAAGHRYLAWYAERDEQVSLRFTTDRSGAWTTLGLGRIADNQEHTAIAVTAGGVAWFASGVPFGASSGFERIRATRVDGSRVTTWRLGTGWWPRIDLDSGERPIVAWGARNGLAVERFGGRGWRRLGLLRPWTWGFLGLDVRGSRIAVAYSADEESTIGEAVGILDGDGHWTTTDIATRMSCTPSTVHLLAGQRVVLPCLGPDNIGQSPPGISLHTVSHGQVTLRTIAPEERSSGAVAARAPDGHLEIVTTRTDGRMVLSRQHRGAWTDELLPPGVPFWPTAFAIGPDGDRAIVGMTAGGVGLIADRSGTWRRTVVAKGGWPQVTIDRKGRYHVGYIRERGSQPTLGVAVGRPGAWDRSRIPGSGDHLDPVFMVAPDGTDAVAWMRRADPDGTDSGIRLARSGTDGWKVARLGHDWYEELWSAAIAPDGTIGLIRGGLTNSRLQELRGHHRTSEPLPGNAFFGGWLAYGTASKPSVAFLRVDREGLFVAQRGPHGWKPSFVTDRPWRDLVFSVTGDGPTFVLGAHGDRARDPGWFVVTRPTGQQMVGQ